jgi:hypothetical protein
MMMRALAFFAFLLARADAQALTATEEFFRSDPFGASIERNESRTALTLRTARNAYTSFHLIVSHVQGPYEIRVELPLATDLYREWFHLATADSKYYPDALIPIHSGYRSVIPEPDNRIANQTAQAFFVDVWVPDSTVPGTYHGKAEVIAGGKRADLPVTIDVLAAKVPDEDAIILDNNSYGTSWLSAQYPKTLSSLESNGDDAELLRLIHAYHRIFYEHRGIFHQLGYGHAGKVGPEFAPALAGTGRNKHVASWEMFDRHYGPLLDGTAFQTTRRGARPISFMYLPVNPEWPASYLWWGEPGYEAEFENVISEIERHFRERKWTSTRLEVFFNQKKRYKGFPWDGDEIRFDRDNQYLIAYHRMLVKALPPDTPVMFVMRADASWGLERQLTDMSGIIRFWVAGQGELSWYPELARKAIERGDIVWTYGGTPTVQEPAARITLDPLRTWITGVQGFVRWLTVSPGPDPWFRFQGGAETLVYPGEQFGISEPIPSVRLKLQRNCLQDLALLEKATRQSATDSVKVEVVKRFNETALSDWHNSRPALADTPVLSWTNADIEDALRLFESRIGKLDAASWLRVREYALEVAR